MSDGEKVDSLLQMASNEAQLQDAQRVAARKLLKFDGEVYPSDGCAITLSILLQDAGIDVPDTYKAIELTHRLRDRNWTRIELGNQQQGDVGTTCGAVPMHGRDHVYLVLRPVNEDEMVIADNQAPHPHMRFASGTGGKTPTKFFLRAPK